LQIVPIRKASGVASSKNNQGRVSTALRRLGGGRGEWIWR